MRRLFTLASALVMLICFKAGAQSFIVSADTVYCGVYGGPDNITNKVATNIPLKWHVTGTDFPADWQTSSAFGVCDNYNCYNNTSNALWNSSTSTGTTYSTTYYANSIHDSTDVFRLSMSIPSSATNGTHWVTINLLDNSTSYSKNITFVLTKTPSSVSSVSAQEEKVSLYPNPASNEINIVCDQSADVKNVAVYNIIGRMMNVYKVSGNNANINIEAMPSGIYFVKLYNSVGNVVVTKKFTKQ